MSSQPTINNIHQALDAAKAAAAKLGSPIWWRGHAALNWALVPSVYRTLRADYSRYEQNVSGRFVSGAGSRHANLPEEGKWDEWLVLMQHYGLPTRLLDWTESVLIAIYFAVRDHQSENGRLFAFSPYKLNEHQSGIAANFTPGNIQVSGLFQPPFRQTAPNPDKIAAFVPTEVDTRMLLQQSGFTVHGNAIPLENLEYHDDILIRWDIPFPAKATFKSELDALGFNESTLFPDLEHLAKYIAGQHYRFPD